MQPEEVPKPEEQQKDEKEDSEGGCLVQLAGLVGLVVFAAAAEWAWDNLWALVTIGAVLGAAVTFVFAVRRLGWWAAMPVAAAPGCFLLGGPAENWLGATLLVLTGCRLIEGPPRPKAEGEVDPAPVSWRLAFARSLKETAAAVAVGLTFVVAVDILLLSRWTPPEDPRPAWQEELRELPRLDWMGRFALASKITAYTPPEPPPLEPLQDWEAGILKVQIAVAKLKVSGWWLLGFLLLSIAITACEPGIAAVSRLLALQKKLKGPLLALSTCAAFTLFAKGEADSYSERWKAHLRHELLTTWQEVDDWRKGAVAAARIEEEIKQLSKDSREQMDSEIVFHSRGFESKRRLEQLGSQLGKRPPLSAPSGGDRGGAGRDGSPSEGNANRAKLESARARAVYAQSREAVIKVLQSGKVTVGHPMLQPFVDAMVSSTVKSSMERVTPAELTTVESARGWWRRYSAASGGEPSKAAAHLEANIANARPGVAAGPVISPLGSWHRQRPMPVMDHLRRRTEMRWSRLSPVRNVRFQPPAYRWPGKAMGWLGKRKR